MKAIPNRLALVALSVTLGACLPHPPPAAAPPEVIAGSTDVGLAQIPAATVARYVGSYRSGSATLIIARAGETLTASPSGRPPTALQLVGLGTFVDSYGTAYLFMPADGSGGRLRSVAADGAAREWVR